MAVDIGTGNHYSIFLKDGVIYSAGENTNSQLARGQGDEAELVSLEPINMPVGFTGTIAGISAGQLHGAFLTTEGEVYTWGDGNLGKLGTGDTTDALTPVKVDALDGITISSIVMGNGASYAISDDGVLYAWAQNTNGQLGIGSTTNQSTPVSVSSASFGDEKVVAVSAGTSFALVLTESGAVYAMGGNVQRQLGPNGGTDNRVTTPVLVDLPGEAVSIEAGTNTAIIITDDGSLYGWGQSDFGQLVKGTIEQDGTLSDYDAEKSPTPTLIPGVPSGITEVHIGSRWVVAITQDGEVWTWGDQGWLDSSKEDVVRAPYKVSGFEGVRIVDIVSGPNHALLVDDEGNVYGLGSAADGRLGFLQADADRASAPVLLSDVSAGIQVVVDGADDQTTGSAITAGPLDDGKTTFHIYGFAGNDTLTGSDETDLLEGGDGDDALIGGRGADTLKGSAGADTLTGGSGRDVFFGTAGQMDGDRITDFRQGDTIRMADEGARIRRLEVQGETLIVTLADSQVASIAVDDMAHKQWTFTGDTISLAPAEASQPDPAVPGAGTEGNDDLRGEELDDVLEGALGGDIVYGGMGHDNIYGNQDDDELYGNQGEDSLFGGQGSDVAFGGQGHDVVYGNRDGDMLYGNRDDDRLFGNQDADWLHGGQGRDSVYGGQGSDTLNGGAGDDLLQGGIGADLFIVDPGQGNDAILDFRQAEGDRLQLQGQSFTLADAADGSVTLLLSGGGTVHLHGVSRDQDITLFTVA